MPRNTDTTVKKSELLKRLILQYESRIRDLKQDTTLKAATLQLDAYGRPGFVGQKEQEIQLLVSQRLKAEGDASEARSAFEAARDQVSRG